MPDQLLQNSLIEVPNIAAVASRRQPFLIRICAIYQSPQKFKLHKQYIIEYTISENKTILREKYEKYTKRVLTIYARFGNILSTDNKDIHSFKGAMTKDH